MKLILITVGIIAILAGAITALIELTTSTDPSITQGVVVEKDYIPGYTIDIPECWGYNANGLCLFEGNVPVEFPDCWQLTLNDPSHHQGTVCVFEFVYDRQPIGSYYSPN